MAQQEPWEGKSAPEQSASFDPGLRFVRVQEVRDDGFVAFDFAVGEPEIFVEMLLTEAAFAEFCETQGVVFLDQPSGQASVTDLQWRLRDAISRRIAVRSERPES